MGPARRSARPAKAINAEVSDEQQLCGIDLALWNRRQREALSELVRLASLGVKTAFMLTRQVPACRYRSRPEPVRYTFAVRRFSRRDRLHHPLQTWLAMDRVAGTARRYHAVAYPMPRPSRNGLKVSTNVARRGVLGCTCGRDTKGRSPRIRPYMFPATGALIVPRQHQWRAGGAGHHAKNH